MTQHAHYLEGRFRCRGNKKPPNHPSEQFDIRKWSLRSLLSLFKRNQTLLDSWSHMGSGWWPHHTGKVLKVVMWENESSYGNMIFYLLIMSTYSLFINGRAHNELRRAYMLNMIKYSTLYLTLSLPALQHLTIRYPQFFTPKVHFFPVNLLKLGLWTKLLAGRTLEHFCFNILQIEQNLTSSHWENVTTIGHVMLAIVPERKEKKCNDSTLTPFKWTDLPAALNTVLLFNCSTVLQHLRTTSHHSFCFFYCQLRKSPVRVWRCSELNIHSPFRLFLMCRSIWRHDKCAYQQ